MAKEIKELSSLPVEHQHLILESFCKNYQPIEIDDKVYLIPEAVSDLIDNLVMQLGDLYALSERDIIGKEEN
tara:strand:- start:244 stop:459 length:216 start_codon:yes stop_codon:yes gene_type:complete